MSELTNKKTIYPILFAISAAHLMNDALQAVIPASYPILREALGLSYTQLGIITFVLFFSSSVMQPFVGMYTDARPSPKLLPIGMGIAGAGMLGLAFSPQYALVLLSVLMVGIASAMYHPEGARIAFLAAGPRRGLAQSIFQVGGNAGSALAPLMTAFIFFPYGQKGAIWFTGVAALGVAIQVWVSRWYRGYLDRMPLRKKEIKVRELDPRKRKQILFAITLVVLIVFARSWYGAGLSNYFVFYLIERFDITVPQSQMYIFLYMGAGIAGTFFGGPLADRFGRKNVILFSVLGAAPFAMLLPIASEVWCYILLFILGLINHSSFSVTVVYVQELVPGKVGTVSGLITGLAFGMGALGAVGLGGLIDLTDLTFVIVATSFLPLLGMMGFLLPSDRKVKTLTETSSV
ncbi:MFS transporter [Cohnella boryungensis]|uniref:MFS transporter n=1 Tax=Cohnella boryungensis TaxID=768479 RepID=A0ABV8S648_9BACL